VVVRTDALTPLVAVSDRTRLAHFRPGTACRIFIVGMRTSTSLRRLSGADRVRLSFADAGGGRPLPLASRRTWIPGLGAGLAFLVVTSMAWEQITYWHSREVHTWFDRVIVLLKGLWVVGLSVGAVVLFAVTIVLLFYRQSARIADGRLIHVAQLGPFRALMEYDLAKVRNLRAVDAGNGRARVWFDYDDGDHKLGRDMTPAEAEARVKMIQAAIDGVSTRRPSQSDAAVPRPTPRL